MRAVILLVITASYAVKPKRSPEEIAQMERQQRWMVLLWRRMAQLLLLHMRVRSHLLFPQLLRRIPCCMFICLKDPRAFTV